MHELQAAAAVGQMGLVQCYESCFRGHGLHTAQVLLTHADLADRQRYLNARSTLRTLLELGVIPVINENDTVVTDEIKFGDNDTLGALVTNLIEADALIILTDQSGPLRGGSPQDQRREARRAGARRRSEAGSDGRRLGERAREGRHAHQGAAAKRAARSGAHTVIASGKEPDVLLRLAQGERIGTLLTARTAPIAARKQWLADHLTVSGLLTLDAGATKALVKDGKSLLPIGVTAVSGEFARGEIVGCIDAAGKQVARGLVNYSSEETRRIMRRASGEIESVLGYVDEPELIHRDNLVLL
jgi:glutamate 5-kinase